MYHYANSSLFNCASAGTKLINSQVRFGPISRERYLSPCLLRTHYELIPVIAVALCFELLSSEHTDYLCFDSYWSLNVS